MILITGASGFVGQALCALLAQRGQHVRRVLRGVRPPDGAADNVIVCDIDATTTWDAALRGVDTVMHLAARTHFILEKGKDAHEAYRKTNVEGTRQLAEQASRFGIRRFMYLSSIKVNGEHTVDRPFAETDTPHPEDAYGLTKWEAEQALWQIAADTGMEVVVLRPPLVYGPGVKGNFLALMKAIRRGLPLPLASVRNRRSLIYVGNLADAILTCIESPAAPGNTYLVSDGDDVSTPELLRLLAAALDVPARLLPCPTGLLRFGGALFGKSGEIARLTGSLQIDSSKIRRELGWRPRLSLASGLEQTARWYLNTLQGKQ
ncbi:MAG: SDR family oxidoreductase [Burkholderiales bacterium]|nr:SDR family oxidoreductase [Burkholderiales bacterium]